MAIECTSFFANKHGEREGPPLPYLTEVRSCMVVAIPRARHANK